MTIRGKYKGAAAAARAYRLDNRQRVQREIDRFRKQGLMEDIVAMNDSPEFSTPLQASNTITLLIFP